MQSRLTKTCFFTNKKLRRVSNKTANKLKLYLLFKPSLILVLIFAGFFRPIKIQAQTVSLSVWPPVLDLSLLPGQTINQPIQIKNLGDQTNISLNLVSFVPADEHGRIQLQPDFDFPAVKFLKLSGNELQLNSGQTEIISLTLTIPQNALSTDYYFALTATASTQGLIKNTGSLSQTIIAIPVLLTIASPAPAQPTAKIEQFSAPLISDSFNPVPFKLRLKNTGPVRLKTVGHIDVYNLFNQKIATIPLRKDNLLVNSVRQLTSETNPDSLFFQALLSIGRYQAIVSITPENSTNTISQTLFFWVLPYKIIVFVIIMAFFFYLYQKQFYLILQSKIIKVYQNITIKLFKKK